MLIIRILFILSIVLLHVSLQAQDKLVIGKSPMVQLVPDTDFDELGNIVWINIPGEDVSCKAMEVYYDESMRNIAYESYSSGDSCRVFQYWPNGSLKKFTLYIKNQNQVPVWWYTENYCENGQILYNGPAPNQIKARKIESYYCNGKKRLEFDQLPIKGFNEINGKKTEWYESGSLKSEEYYEMGVNNGEWIYYNQNGKITKIEWYNKGTLIKKEEY